MMTVQLRFYTDPACPWSWAAEPALGRTGHTHSGGRTLRGCGRRCSALARVASVDDQWNESPQAQEPVAFGLSIVKPCFSIESMKSMFAPLR